jgi:hypothetical protein
MARVYAMSDPLTGEEHDLDKAIHFATRAVAGDPQNPAFSETLAILQVLAGREAEARQVFVDTGAIGHPMLRLLKDRSQFPVPESAVGLETLSRLLAEQQMASGSIRDYGILRVASFGIDRGASFIEAQCRERWAGFELKEMEREKGPNGTEMITHMALFDWDEDDPIPSPKEVSERARAIARAGGRDREPNCRDQPAGCATTRSRADRVVSGQMDEQRQEILLEQNPGRGQERTGSDYCRR